MKVGGLEGEKIDRSARHIQQNGSNLVGPELARGCNSSGAGELGHEACWLRNMISTLRVVKSLAGMKRANIIRVLSLMARWLEDIGGQRERKKETSED